MSEDLLFTGKGFLEQVKENYEFSTNINKEDLKTFCMSISDENFETLWKESFGETYEEFVNKMLNYDTNESK